MRPDMMRRLTLLVCKASTNHQSPDNLQGTFPTNARRENCSINCHPEIVETGKQSIDGIATKANLKDRWKRSGSAA